MARRKTRRVATRRASPFKRTARRKSSTGGKVQAIQMDAMLYGAVRGYTSNLLSPLVDKIPLGDISDELAMGLANYFIAKNTKGMIRNVALKGLVIENARLGEAIVTGGLGSLTPQTNKATMFVYG